MRPDPIRADRASRRGGPGPGPRKGRSGPLPVLLLVLLLLLGGCSDFTLLPFETPTADPGPDRKATLGSLVILDGSRSRDPQGEPLAYEWSFGAKPAGSAAVLLDNATPTPRFTSDRAGAYEIRLVVRDLSLNRSPMARAVVTVVPGESRLPDTGQDNCYDGSTTIPFPAESAPFHGQDGQYVTNPPRLSDNGAVVHDDVTGLDWQKGDDGAAYNWYGATGTAHPAFNPSGGTDACRSLSLGGFTDWRLPSRHELATITLLSGVSPALDRARFPGAAAVPYWTSSESGIGVSPFPGWAIDFGSGAIVQDGKDVAHRVRCVRGSFGRSVFESRLDGTVTDCTTRLVWQQTPVTGRSWAGALAYCETLTLGGSSDWRLPNARELGSLVRLAADNGTGSAPTIDPAAFPATASGPYWSSTSRVEGAAADNAWTVDFTTGAVDGTGSAKGSPSPWVRCVR